MKYPTAGGEYVAPKEPKPEIEKPQEVSNEPPVSKRPEGASTAIRRQPGQTPATPPTPDTPDTTVKKE